LDVIHKKEDKQAQPTSCKVLLQIFEKEQFPSLILSSLEKTRNVTDKIQIGHDPKRTNTKIGRINFRIK